MTGDRVAYLRVQQYYGEMLADFRRQQADLAAEHDAKIAGWRLDRQQAEGADEDSPAKFDTATFDEDDFSNNTWLR